ncbi:MAG: UDP binding domain-containing protein, partial [Alcaligenaceae bacterium]
IDDLRESPAVQIALALVQSHFDIVAVEPNIETHEGFKLLGLDVLFTQVDVIAVLVKHREFCESGTRKKLAVFGALDFCGLGLK